MTLHNEQDAIKQAVLAGYTGGKLELILPMGIVTSNYDPEFTTLYVLQDPAFWQALGKARGWDTGPFHWSSEYRIQVKPTGRHKCNEDCSEDGDWKHYALNYFETRLSNGDMQAYWQSLP